MHASDVGVVVDISKSKRLCCIVFPLERKKGPETSLISLEKESMCWVFFPLGISVVEFHKW